MEIREARLEDAEEILCLSKQIGGESDNMSHGAEGLDFSVEEEKSFIQRTKDSENSCLLVAKAEGEIAGTCIISGMPRRLSHRGELGISVQKKFWNQHIGSALVNEALAMAETQLGLELITLEVRTDNHAGIHLYKKFGFKEIGILERSVKVNGEYFDLVMMALHL